LINNVTFLLGVLASDLTGGFVIGVLTGSAVVLGGLADFLGSDSGVFSAWWKHR
jgi:hypothetical protein